MPSRGEEQMSYAGITRYAPDPTLSEKIEENRKKREKIIQDHYGDMKLRVKHKGLRNAWEKYQVMLKLVKE